MGLEVPMVFGDWMKKGWNCPVFDLMYACMFSNAFKFQTSTSQFPFIFSHPSNILPLVCFSLFWRRLSVVKDESHHRGLPHFPSVLKQRGPQYPFQPFELTYLRSVVGSTRGTELNQPIELPEVSKEQREEAMKIHQGQWGNPGKNDKLETWGWKCGSKQNLLDANL